MRDAKPKQVIKFLAEPKSQMMNLLKGFAAAVDASAVLYTNERDAAESLTGENECLIFLTNRCSADFVEKAPEGTKIILHKTPQQTALCFKKLDKNIFKAGGLIVNTHGKFIDSHLARQAIFSSLTSAESFDIKRLVGWNSPFVDFSNLSHSKFFEEISSFSKKYYMPVYLRSHYEKILNFIQQLTFIDCKISAVQCTTDSVVFASSFSIEFNRSLEDIRTLGNFCHQLQQLSLPGLLVNIIGNKSIELVVSTNLLLQSEFSIRTEQNQFFVVGLQRVVQSGDENKKKEENPNHKVDQAG